MISEFRALNWRSCERARLFFEQKNLFIGANGKVDTPLALTGPGLQRAKMNAVDPWSFGWTEFKTTFNSKKNTEIGLTIYLHFTKGTIWVDDVELIEVK